jgi:Cu/Zn superoxide dismutase
VRVSKPFLTALICAAAAASLTTSVLAQDKADKSITIVMKALNGSGEDGTAVLTQTGKDVRIVIALKNGPPIDQPTHIHAGTCSSINPSPEFPLASTNGGKSTYVLHGETLDFLTAHAYAINIHKSTSDLPTYVSCGNIKA